MSNESGNRHQAVAPARNAPQLGNPDQVVRTVFGCAPEEIAAHVILSPFVPLKAFRRHVTGDVISLSPPFFFKGFTAFVAGHRVTVILTGVGPSRIGDCLGFLALTPARHVLFVGAVGALNPRYQIGDFFLPASVTDGEGYSRYCREPLARLAAGAPELACPGTTDPALVTLLQDRGHVAHRGRVFTIGSIAFESPENLRALRELNFDALEMELSAFYSASAMHSFLPAALTYVSDLPLTRSLWQEKSAAERERLQHAYRALPRLALEYAASAS